MLATTALLIARSSGGATAASKAWPTRPVRILVGFPGGSTADMAARALAEPLSHALGQPVIVENKPGALGNIAADQVAKATDDHTLGLVINSTLTWANLLYPKLPFDAAKDFSLISLLTTAPLMVVAPASAPEGAAYFAVAAQSGDKWNFGAVGSFQLSLEVLKSKVKGLTPTIIPFKGSPEIMTALLSGEVQMALVPPGVAMQHVKAGKLKAIGLSGGRNPLAPNVPALSDAGVRDFNLGGWTALVGPAKLSEAALERLKTEVPKIMHNEETRRRLFEQGWQASGSSAEELRSAVNSEAAVMREVVTTRGIKLE